MYTEEFIRYYSENIQREGSAELLEWLKTTDFFSAPASTHFHGDHEGGLCEHSLNVFRVRLVPAAEQAQALIKERNLLSGELIV